MVKNNGQETAHTHTISVCAVSFVEFNVLRISMLAQVSLMASVFYFFTGDLALSAILSISSSGITLGLYSKT